VLRLHTAEYVSGRSPPQVRHSGPAVGIAADGQDVALVRVEVTDAAGRFVPDASDNVTFSVTGPGRIYGVGNGDPTDHDPDKATVRAHPGRLSTVNRCGMALLHGHGGRLTSQHGGFRHGQYRSVYKGLARVIADGGGGGGGAHPICATVRRPYMDFPYKRER
jgi:hypothetical protein